jgi:hypothetical protein
MLGVHDSVLVAGINIMFQGGFSVRTLKILDHANQLVADFHPEDTNKEQSFIFPQPICMTRLKLLLNDGYDFYNRVVVYRLSLQKVE